MITTLKWLAIVAVAFVAGGFLASPELRAYAANTVFSADIKDGEVKTADLANNAVTSAKIKDGEIKTDDIAPSAIGSLRIKDNDVKAQDIAPDAVGASEIAGVTKLIFANCNADSAAGNGGVQATNIGVKCNIAGVDSGDFAVALVKTSGNVPNNICFAVHSAISGADSVVVRLTNVCPSFQTWKTGDTISIIVYDK